MSPIPMNLKFKVVNRSTGHVWNEEEATKMGFFIEPCGKLMKAIYMDEGSQKISGYINEAEGYDVIYVMTLPDGYEIRKRDNDGVQVDEQENGRDNSGEGSDTSGICPNS